MNGEGQNDESELDFEIEDAAEEIGAELFSESETPEVETPAVEETPAVGAPAPEINSPEVAALGAPDTWTKEAIAEWATVPARVQQEILKRESDMIKGIESYRERASAGDTYNEILAPYAQVLQQTGLDPRQMLSSFAYNHAQLSFGSPQEKLQLAQNLLTSYGIDPVELALAMGQQKPVDPEIQQLRQQVQQTNAVLTQFQQSQQQAALEQVNAEIAAFAADPANIYFRELDNDIVALLEKGAASSLPEAYEKAIWLNESTRQKEMARLTAAQAAPTPAPVPSQKARALASNVDTTPKPGNGAMPVGSMEDTLEEAYASISSR